ncbi:hypothetical protein KC19_3G209900 [Ceratodon purpureus]|uniref:Uncharacterized protein n=1 Tax=Ceratodon purpureus TaxID=3225 RepID=A0A8T0IPU1_CERPU|nr:hypothetical protein KC19_3G209900 [Ceratodon purpureus]
MVRGSHTLSTSHTRCATGLPHNNLRIHPNSTRRGHSQRLRLLRYNIPHSVHLLIRHSLVLSRRSDGLRLSILVERMQQDLPHRSRIVRRMLPNLTSSRSDVPGRTPLRRRPLPLHLHGTPLAHPCPCTLHCSLHTLKPRLCCQ